MPTSEAERQLADVLAIARAAFIDGEWVFDGSDAFDVLDPATGELLARVASASDSTVDVAVRVAAAAQPGWAALTPRQRGRQLRAVAALIRQHADELAELESRENGKPRRDARAFDIEYAIATFEYFAGLADTLHGEIIDQGPIEARIVPEPYGVVGAILPFNWPPIHFAAKTAPALAAGNAIVIKPGEQAPLTVLRLVELAASVLPRGVIGAVAGLSAGPALSAHPGVGRLTFTGSPETGRRVLAAAAANLTPCTMELGGKNALIVFPDADLDAAIGSAIEGMYFNQGEACTATTRILLHEDVYAEFARRFALATEELIVGRGVDDRSDVGPMVDGRQRDRVLAHLQTALDEGAKLLAQAPIPDDPALAGGFWVAPTLLGDVTIDMRIAREEVFGPVATLMRFETEAEAIDIANGTEYGLTAALFTRDIERASRVGALLEAGMVFVNNYFRASLLGSPFGGVKSSGYGREGAAETLHEFVRSKNLRFPSGRAPVPLWSSAQRIAEKVNRTAV